MVSDPGLSVFSEVYCSSQHWAHLETVLTVTGGSRVVRALGGWSLGQLCTGHWPKRELCFPTHRHCQHGVCFTILKQICAFCILFCIYLIQKKLYLFDNKLKETLGARTLLRDLGHQSRLIRVHLPLLASVSSPLKAS